MVVARSENLQWHECEVRRFIEGKAKKTRVVWDGHERISEREATMGYA